MTGTTIAQAFPIAISPILTRLYTPEEFGLFSLCVGLSSFLLVFATAKYELAIILPVKDSEALEIVKLTCIISVLASIFIFLTILIFNNDICNILGNQEIKKWLYFIPISTFITGIYRALNYWFNRKKDFKRLAANRIIQSSSTGSFQAISGFLGFSGIGLLFGSIIGQFITVISLIIKVFKQNKKELDIIKINNLRNLMIRYSNFPKYDLPTSLLSVGSTHAPNILFTAIFSSSFSGFYYLTQRVLQAPITLISTSVLDVFKEEAARSYRETGQAKEIYLKTFKWLLLISLIPSIVLFFFIEDLFVFFFGPEWVQAGTYAKILLPSLTIKFLVNPLSFMIYVAEKQKWNLFIMIFLVSGMIMSFYLADNPKGVVEFISITLIIYYIIHLFISAKLAKVF
jgi:O-antigen/teichoic acid export membrane protein